MLRNRLSILVMFFVILLLSIAIQGAENTNNVFVLKPVDVVKKATETVLSITQKNLAHEKMYALIHAEIAPYIDLSKISRLVLGKHWKTSTPIQQNRFKNGFQRLLINTYLTMLSEKIKINIVYSSSVIDEIRGKARVKVFISKNVRSESVEISYKLYKMANAWKIYDVSIEGVGIIMNYRSSYNDQIRKNGLDSLIEKIEEKNTQK